MENTSKIRSNTAEKNFDITFLPISGDLYTCYEQKLKT